jgi:hypothetical protein
MDEAPDDRTYSYEAAYLADLQKMLTRLPNVLDALVANQPIESLSLSPVEAIGHTNGQRSEPGAPAQP